MTLSITALRIMVECYYAECRICSVANKPLILNAVILNVTVPIYLPWLLGQLENIYLNCYSKAQGIKVSIVASNPCLANNGL
jgi:hypothetical protein